MSYTWEEVILGIDLKHEMDEKERQQEDIEAAATKESSLQAAWSLGLSVLGLSLGFGPVGYFIGKQLGKWGADAGILPGTKDASQWESMTIEEGKFFAKDAKKFNEDLKKKAKEINQGQLVDSVIDLGTMWVQAGGLQEGFDPTIGGGDWTTFGTGDTAWNLRGRGYDPQKATEMADLYYTKHGTMEGFDWAGGEKYVSSLFDSDTGGFLSGLKEGGKRLGKTYGQEQQVKGVASGAKTLDQYYKEYIEG